MSTRPLRPVSCRTPSLQTQPDGGQDFLTALGGVSIEEDVAYSRPLRVRVSSTVRQSAVIEATRHPRDLCCATGSRFSRRHHNSMSQTHSDHRSDGTAVRLRPVSVDSDHDSLRPLLTRPADLVSNIRAVELAERRVSHGSGGYGNIRESMPCSLPPTGLTFGWVVPLRSASMRRGDVLGIPPLCEGRPAEG